MTTSEGYSRLRAKAEQELRDNPPPILLTKVDALCFAAECLERNASSLKLVAKLLDLAKGVDLGDAKLLAEIRHRAVEPDLQLAAMKAAAGAIREMALEERLVAARVAREAERRR